MFLHFPGLGVSCSDLSFDRVSETLVREPVLEVSVDGLRLSQWNILLVVIFLVEAVHQLGGRDGPELWHTDVEAIAVAWRIARHCCFLDLHSLPVGVDHALENDLDRELGVRRELRHRVILLVKYSHVDMLIANVGDFERLFE